MCAGWIEAGSTRGVHLFLTCVSPLLRREEVMESSFYVAGIDVHKKMLAVVVANARDTELEFECRAVWHNRK